MNQSEVRFFTGDSRWVYLLTSSYAFAVPSLCVEPKRLTSRHMGVKWGPKSPEAELRSGSLDPIFYRQVANVRKTTIPV